MQDIFNTFALQIKIILIIMNREEINTMAAQWISIASSDLKEKLMSLANEANINAISLAPLLGMSSESLRSLLGGNRIPSLDEFVKIMILTGNALSIQPLNGDVPHSHIPMHEERRSPQEATHEVPPFNGRLGGYTPPIPTTFRQIPIGDGSQRNIPMGGRNEREHTAPRSPFESMPRERLVRIIKAKLWDSEIDTFGSTRDELIKFLENKDRQIREYQKSQRGENENRTERNNVERSPELMKFVNGLKTLVDTNPAIKDVVKSLVKDL